MSENEAQKLKIKTVEDLDLAKYQEGTGEYNDLKVKHGVKVKSQFALVS